MDLDRLTCKSRKSMSNQAYLSAANTYGYSLGAEGRGFESLRPDHRKSITYITRALTSPSDCGDFCGESFAPDTKSSVLTAARFDSFRACE